MFWIKLFQLEFRKTFKTSKKPCLQQRMQFLLFVRLVKSPWQTMNLARWLQLMTWTRMEKWISTSSKWWWLPTSSKMRAQTTTKSGTTETHTIHAHICKLGCYFNEIRMSFLQFCQINIKIGLMSNSSSEKLTLKQSDMIPSLGQPNFFWNNASNSTGDLGPKGECIPIFI